MDDAWIPVVSALGASFLTSLFSYFQTKQNNTRQQQSELAAATKAREDREALAQSEKIKDEQLRLLKLQNEEKERHEAIKNCLGEIAAHAGKIISLSRHPSESAASEKNQATADLARYSMQLVVLSDVFTDITFDLPLLLVGSMSVQEFLDSRLSEAARIRELS